ncbi:putative leucine zipper protein [Paratrimastix pyriformis]|uniref:Defective in cullin neddylation protein n=1 Tax=Paratrimastix pyriformis TaxID=342808 RepID=A0ABQ8UU55_9EUKA|nr:putative leucine zipper protein [Paratrimastix pyriformis]
MQMQKQLNAKPGMKIKVFGNVTGYYFSLQLQLRDPQGHCLCRANFSQNCVVLSCQSRGRWVNETRASGGLPEGNVTIEFLITPRGFEVSYPNRGGDKTECKMSHGSGNDVTKGRVFAVEETSSFDFSKFEIDDPAEGEARQAAKREFMRLKDPNEPMISIAGTEQMCQELGVEPDDVVMLVVAWRCHCKEMCEWTEEEFVDGLRAMDVTSLSQLRPKMAELRRDVQQGGTRGSLPPAGPGSFQDFYMFAHRLSCGKRSPILEPPQHCLVTPTHTHTHQESSKEYKNITRDTWDQIRRFFMADKDGQFGTDFAQYDASGAWPNCIDDYVEWIRHPPQPAAPAPAQ